MAVLARATGRTLVLPPAGRVYLLQSAGAMGFSDVFPLAQVRDVMSSYVMSAWRHDVIMTSGLGTSFRWRGSAGVMSP